MSTATPTAATSSPPSSHRPHQNTNPIPIKQRHRSSFSSHAVRKRRPSDAILHAVAHSGSSVEDRDRVTSSRLQAALSLSPPGLNQGRNLAPMGAGFGAGHISKSAPGLEEGTSRSAGSTAVGGNKKKGPIFRCETCAKAYRHPSCLVKHRWEHSPHWREASKFLLSKHQQVQLLEAAAILSHLSPSKSGGGTSLPEDRSLWPSYLSGGLLPMPTTNVHFLNTSSDVGNMPMGVTMTSSPPSKDKEDASMSTSDEDESDVETPPSITNASANMTTSDRAVGSKSPTPMQSKSVSQVPTLTQFRPGLLGHPNPPPYPAYSSVHGFGGPSPPPSGSTATPGVAPIPVPTRYPYDNPSSTGSFGGGDGGVGGVASWDSANGSVVSPPPPSSVGSVGSMTAPLYNAYTTSPHPYGQAPSHSYGHTHTHSLGGRPYGSSYGFAPAAHSYSYSFAHSTSPGLWAGRSVGTSAPLGAAITNAEGVRTSVQAPSYDYDDTNTGGKSWSLPRSSVRSGGAGNGESDDEGADIDFDIEGMDDRTNKDTVDIGKDTNPNTGDRAHTHKEFNREEEEWDMEMVI